MDKSRKLKVKDWTLPTKVATRKAKAEAARLLRENQNEADYHYHRGFNDGVKKAEDAAKQDMRIKLLEGNLKLAQQVGQLVEASARAVIALLTEGGIPKGGG